MNILSRATILAAMLAAMGCASFASEPPVVEEQAPFFKLVDHQGQLVSYQEDYYGRHHLVLTFFPAAFTPV